MTRLLASANAIAFAAARFVLSAGRPLTFQVGEATVRGGCSSRESTPWPEPTPPGLDRQQLDAWPPTIVIDATWNGGEEKLLLSCRPARGGRYRGCIGLAIATSARRLVLWINLTAALLDATEGSIVPAEAYAALGKRRDPKHPDRMARLNDALQDLVGRSGLPLLSSARVEAFRIEVPSGAVLPSADVAFERLVHLALYKLDFIDPKHTKERGAPLIDVAALVGEPVTDVEAGDDETVEEGQTVSSSAQSPRPRRYWAVGSQSARRRSSTSS